MLIMRTDQCWLQGLSLCTSCFMRSLDDAALQIMAIYTCRAGKPCSWFVHVRQHMNLVMTLDSLCWPCDKGLHPCMTLLIRST